MAARQAPPFLNRSLSRASPPPQGWRIGVSSPKRNPRLIKVRHHVFMIKPVSLPESSHATGSRRIHQITLDEGRTVEQKKRFYKTIAERREDAFINLA